MAGDGPRIRARGVTKGKGRVRNSRGSSLPAALVVALTAFLALIAVPASAKQIHKFSNAFGTPASDTTLSLASNSGLAVNETSHDIYIADTGNHRIVEFSAAGAFIRAFGADVGGAGVNVCTTGCQAGTAGTSPGFFESPTFLAIDNSGGASNEDLYVVDSATHVVSKFEADGTLVSSWGNNGVSEAPSGQLAGKTQAEPFTQIAGIAVDSAGELAVLEVEPRRLFRFEQDGSFSAEVETPRLSAARGLSVDGENNFFKINGDYSIQKFAPSGTNLGQISKNEANTGLAADPATHPDVLYADVGIAINVYAFNGGEVINPTPTGSCVPTEFTGCPASERFGEGALNNGGGLAVDGSSGTVYAADTGTSSIVVFPVLTLPDVTTTPAEVHSTTTATLNGEVNPDEVPLEECFFEYGETTEYGATAPCEAPDAEEVGAGNSPVPVHADLTNLTPGATYHYRLVAANENGTNSESGDQEFFTGPSILSTFASEVSATAATLNTEINPNGVATTYRFQYVADSAFQQSGYATAAEAPAGGELIGSGTSPVFRSRPLQGLTPSTTYHFHVLAESALGTVEGPDRTFTTQFSGLGFQLPDARAWEMVSPPNKHGAKLTDGGENGEYPLQASSDGNGLAYQSYLSTEADPEGNRIAEPSMNLARRQADGSWRSKDITPPNQFVKPITIGFGTEYKLFSPDLSEALVEPRSGTPLSFEASPERTPYLREEDIEEPFGPPTWTPLVTGKEPYANVPPGTEFGGGVNATGSEEATGSVKVVAVSRDFRHFGLSSRVPLVEDAPTGGETLYEWSRGQIEAVSVLPDGEKVAGDFIGSGPGSVRGAVSRDGSRVFWSLGGGKISTISALYVRDTEAEDSGRLDVEQAGASGVGGANPIFQAASADGTVVFFTDSQQLTEAASSQGADLYRCEILPGSVAAGCATLTDISVPTGAGENAEVQGVAAAVTEDGMTVYFVANGVLDETPNKLGDVAVSGLPNLYVWQQGEGVRFIATLGHEDGTDWGQTVTSFPDSSAGALTADASPNGRYLGFMSQRSLTGYDNRDRSSGKAAQEVFRYDSATEQLECVSCNPTGGRPHSASPSQFNRPSFVDPGHLWQGLPVAAALPEATQTANGGVSFYRPRAVLDNGRVFFNAIDPLSPADSNGQWDAYQYESASVGDCSSSSTGASISHLGSGCVALISSGTGEEEAAFFDASESGDDAFFWTPAQLNETDTDHEVDLYDARVEGIPATLPKATECLGEACQPAAQAPNDPTPASAAFNGTGNVKPARKHCGKGKSLVRHRGKTHCVSRKHRHKHKRNGGKSRRAHR